LLLNNLLGGCMFMEKMFNKFTEQYSLTKMLKFSLEPIGETRETLEKSLQRDHQRFIDFMKAKKLLDEFHREVIIMQSLNSLSLNWKPLFNNLHEYKTTYRAYQADKKSSAKRNNYKQADKSLKQQQKQMRETIASLFHSHSAYPNLFKKELITKEMPIYLKDRADDLKIIQAFQKLNGYFEDYHKNRKNMYKNDKNTAISYRVVNINFIKYCHNIDNLQKIQTECPGILVDVNSEIHTPNYYNYVITSEGINKYNLIIGEINKALNLYDQKQKTNLSRKMRLARLHNQIMFSGEKKYIDSFNTIQEVNQAVKEFYPAFIKEYLSGIKDMFCDMEAKYDCSQIYIKDTSGLSILMYGNWTQIDSFRRTRLQDSKKSEDKINAELKKPATWEEILSLPASQHNIEEIVFSLHDSIINNYHALNFENEDIFTVDLDLIKVFMDSMQDLTRFIKNFNPPKQGDIEFYAQHEYYTTILQEATRLYNKVRNFITQKPDQKNKFQLAFNHTEFLKGWDSSDTQTKKRGTLILTKDNKYYLGVIDKEHINEFLKKLNKIAPSEQGYQRVEYKQVQNPAKDLPRIFFTKKLKLEYVDINTAREANKHKPGDAFDKEFLNILINYYKEKISNYPNWDVYQFQFSNKEYDTIDEFYSEVTEQGYTISFGKCVSEEFINECVSNGLLYLFKIHNKDYADKPTGNKNLHTLYWEAIYKEGSKIKLNGNAEMFYRKPQITDPVIHKKGSIIVNRRDREGKPIPEDTYRKIVAYLNGGPEPEGVDLSKIIYREAPHDIIKDKRYTEEKFLLHVPIKINYYNGNPTKDFNQQVLDVIKNNPDLHILGIDRGEKNLLYVSVINLKGEIVYQKSLNIINKFDYHEKLTQRYQERQQARVNWDTITPIKDFKTGYLSHAVHEITELMVKYNAILVMEKLNAGFKRTRSKFDYSVYQKFENMLISKLNYLTFKESGVSNGYQLTTPQKLEDNTSQNGFIFYVPAAYTSAIDPTTGFANIIKYKYNTMKEAKEFFSKFDKIRFNGSEDYFEFHIDYEKLPTSQQDYINKWVVCTYGDKRYFYSPKEKKTKTVNVTQELKNLFCQYNIDIHGDLKEAICNQTEAKFYERLSFLFKLTMNMRYSNRDEKEDFILSPVKNKQGEFFISCSENNNLPKKLPTDGDANGAYHIALKGLQLISGITKSYGLPNITTTDWFKYAQQRHQEK